MRGSSSTSRNSCGGSRERGSARSRRLLRAQCSPSISGSSCRSMKRRSRRARFRARRRRPVRGHSRSLNRLSSASPNALCVPQVRRGSVGRRICYTAAGQRSGRGLLVIENAADLGGQIGIGEGLENDLDVRIEPALMHDGVARISGREPHLEARPSARCGIRELPTVHPARQYDIGEQKIHLGMGFQLRERTGAVLGIICESPSPVPWPGSFVVKKGSKAWAINSFVMPLPVSVGGQWPVTRQASIEALYYLFDIVI